jgi:hypothetical protein
VRVVPVSWFAPENFVVNSWRLRLSILTESSIRWQTCPICWAPESETTPENGILNLFYRSPIRVALDRYDPDSGASLALSKTAN